MTEHNNMTSSPVDPVSGAGCIGPRRQYDASRLGLGTLWLPQAMWTEGDNPDNFKTLNQFNRARCRHDFQFWAHTCCFIRDKMTGRQIPFDLNAPQRHVTSILESQRLEGKPLRLIMLKARQWGGSTLIQMYMAWIQCTRLTNWNSLICAHVKDTAATIRGMYSAMLAHYPAELWDGEEDSQGRVPKPEFRPYERSVNVREITGRGCRVTLGSSENHEAVRGADYAMAHLSEVAFWASSPQRSPQQFVRAICGAINTAPYTLIVMESTANGVGNYFHAEWLRAEAGLSDKTPVFIPWYMIEIYRRTLDIPLEQMMASLDDYERSIMHDHNLSPEQIYWYHHKRRELQSLQHMQAEYPTTPVEAFANSGLSVFRRDDVERLRSGCQPPLWRGEMIGPITTGEKSLESLKPVEMPGGLLAVWKHPDPAVDRLYYNRYIASVDIGGRSDKADYSVIAVFDRLATPGALQLVAQWRGHCDHDILAWKAAAIARHYCDALLVFESNTLESDHTDGDPASYILTSIARCYPAIYHRHDPFTGASRPGFHTNRATKTEMVTRLITALRDGTLVERDQACVDEFATFEQLPSGTTAAREGCHDDMLVTRGIALSVHARIAPPHSYQPAVDYVRTHYPA